MNGEDNGDDPELCERCETPLHHYYACDCLLALEPDTLAEYEGAR